MFASFLEHRMFQGGGGGHWWGAGENRSHHRGSEVWGHDFGEKRIMGKGKGVLTMRKGEGRNRDRDIEREGEHCAEDHRQKTLPQSH